MTPQPSAPVLMGTIVTIEVVAAHDLTTGRGSSARSTGFARSRRRCTRFDRQRSDAGSAARGRQRRCRRARSSSRRCGLRSRSPRRPAAPSIRPSAMHGSARLQPRLPHRGACRSTMVAPATMPTYRDVDVDAARAHDHAAPAADARSRRRRQRTRDRPRCARAGSRSRTSRSMPAATCISAAATPAASPGRSASVIRASDGDLRQLTRLGRGRLHVRRLRAVVPRDARGRPSPHRSRAAARARRTRQQRDRRRADRDGRRRARDRRVRARPGGRPRVPRASRRRGADRVRRHWSSMPPEGSQRRSAVRRFFGTPKGLLIILLADPRGRCAAVSDGARLIAPGLLSAVVAAALVDCRSCDCAPASGSSRAARC